MSGPTDRPPLSIPREALTVGIWLYLAWGTIPAFWMMSAPVMIGIDRDWLGDYLLAFVLVAGISLLALAFVFRSGSLRGLWTLRFAAWLLASLDIAGLLDNSLVAMGWIGSGTGYARSSGQFGALAFLLIGSPLVTLLLCGIVRVRWLDPRSAPQEWEKPLRHKV
jgi:hypothetical protein